MLPLVLALLIAAPSVHVVDGDTLRLAGERIRIENLDAPDVDRNAKCAKEDRLGKIAKAKLEALVYRPGANVTLIRATKRTHDFYGRTLARVLVDGEDVSGPMIAAGVARPWRGRSSDWCGSSSGLK